MMRDWIQAYGVSVMVHAGIAAVLMLRIPLPLSAPESVGPVTITLAAASAPAPAPVEELRPEPLSPVAAPMALSPIAADAALAPIAVPTPDAPAPPPAEPTDAGSEMSELAQRIRARITDPCLIALPLEGAEVVVLSSDDRAILDFSADVLDDPAGSTARPVLVDGRQCPAVDFARANAAYPAFPLAVALRTADVPDPGTLSGQVRAAAGRHVTLLLVDDNGVVQDLRRFMRFAGPVAQFEVPIRRDGGARDTAQMLVALATTAPPRAVAAEDGQTADRMFAALTAELGTNVAMSVIAFNLR